MQASITCELREVVLRNKPVQLIALSPKATVPVLQLQSGEVLDESIDVMNWALAQSDPDDWLGADTTLTTRLVEHNDSAFKDDLDRYKYHVNHPAHPQRYYRDRAAHFLAELEALLRQHEGLGLADRRLSFADIAVFPFIRQFSRVDLGWFEQTPYERLKHWLQCLEQSPLYLSVMKKYPPWSAGDATTLFGAPAR